MQRTTRDLGALTALLFLTGAAQADLSTLAPNTWVSVTPTYSGGPNGGAHRPQGWNNKAVFDPATERTIFWDRWSDSVHGDSIYANTLFAFDPASNAISVLKVNNWQVTPTPACPGCFSVQNLSQNATDPTPLDRHPTADIVLVPDKNRLYLSNGLNGAALYGGALGQPITDTWAFDLPTLSWSLVNNSSVAVYPAGGQGQVMAYDPVAKMVVYIQPTNSGGAQTWLLDPAVNQWKSVLPDASAATVPVIGSAIAYDTLRGRHLLLGGGWLPATANSQLWAYSVSQNQWTHLADCPVAAPAPAFDYDSNHDVFLAVLGTQTWLYNPQTNAWSQLTSAVPRPSSMIGQPLVYDPLHDVFVFMGGSADAGPVQWMIFRYGSTVAAPLIQLQPLDCSVEVSATAAFMVQGSGTPAPSYQWQMQSSLGSSFVDIPGATSSTYLRSNVILSDSGTQFRCTLSNSQGSLTTSTATLTVTPAATPILSLSQTQFSFSESAEGTVSTEQFLLPTNVGVGNLVWSANHTSSWLIITPATGSAGQQITLSAKPQGLSPGTYSDQLVVYAANTPNAPQSVRVMLTVGQSQGTQIVIPTTDLARVRVFPNPWRHDKHNNLPIQFDQMPFGSQLVIFSVSGHLVISLQAPEGVALWNGLNTSGEKVSSGVYLYIVTDPQGQKKRGKIALIK